MYSNNLKKMFSLVTYDEISVVASRMYPLYGRSIICITAV